ncbi:MAG: FecR domain-containing protein [Rhizobacter sp.]
MTPTSTDLPTPHAHGPGEAPPERTTDPIARFEPALRQAFPSREALLAEARAQTARQRSRKRAAGGTLAVAAFALAVWLDPAWQHDTLRTAIAERSTVTLPDGSTLTLGPDTVLYTEAHLFSRQFTLVQGEAMFNVGKSPLHAWRPFIVNTDGAHVRDIGTRFNVKLREHITQVTVTEGLVEVSSPQTGATPQRVFAGQAWTIDRRSPVNALPLVAPADLAQATAWQRGKLVFDGTPLAQVLAEVQRYRRAPVQVLDDRAARMRVSGEYDAAGVEALIDALPATLPVRVQRAADGSVTVRAR